MTDQNYSEAPRRARRAAPEEADEVVVPDDTADEASHSPWMRPSAQEPAAPVKPSRGHVVDEADQSPAPRRSAASTTTPTGIPGFTAPVRPEPPAEEPGPEAPGAEEAADELRTTPAQRNPWVLRSVAAVLVLALAGGTFYLVQRSQQTGGQVVNVTTSPGSSTSSGGVEPITDASLAEPSEVAKALGSRWEVLETLQQVDPSTEPVTCQEAPKALPNSLATRQRTMRSTSAAGTAMIQRLDAYADVATAQQAYQTRLGELSACDDVPAQIVTAATVEGAADEAYSVTISLKRETATQFQTIVVSRTGTAVSMVDVGQGKERVPADKVAQVVATSGARLCTSAKGTCPTTLRVRDAVVPPTPIFGWLAQSDLPRITPGHGIWTSTEPATVTSKGSQCENVTLADAPGPTQRQQRAYLLDQDDAAPEGFGIDQVRFTFANANQAKEFSDKLIENIRGCQKRSQTATVTDDKSFHITGQNRVGVTGQIFKVTQKTGESSEVQFRVAVVMSTTKVTYLVSNTRKTFDFSLEEWQQVSARAGQRITQTR